MALPVDQQRRVERLVVWDGVFSRVMDSWTGGVFLAGLGLLVGAGPLLLGLLAALPFLAQTAQLPAVHLLLKVHDRRRIVVLAALGARLLFAAVAVLAFTGRLNAGLLVALMALVAVLVVLATAAWNTWMRDILDPTRLGRFFAHRLQVSAVLGAAAILLGGAVVDRFSGQGRGEMGYGLLFGLGALAGGVALLFLLRTPSPPAAPPPPGARAGRLVGQVLRDPHNRPMIVGLALVAAGMAAALPLAAVYLMHTLGYGILVATLLALGSQVAYVLGLRAWGRLSDRFGNRPVLEMAAALLGLTLVGWSIAWTPGTGLLVHLGMLHVLTGLALGGLELASNNLLLKTAPPDNAPAYLAGLGLARASVAGVATLAAGAIWQFLGQGVVVRVVDWSLGAFHLLALGSAVLAFVSYLALRRVPEPGVTPVREVVRAVRREVPMLSSVAGTRGFVHVGSYVAVLLRGRRSPIEPGKGTQAEDRPDK